MYKVIGRLRLKKLFKRKSEKQWLLPAKLGFALLAAVMAQGSVLGSLFPFGVALLAAAPQGFCFSGFLGACAGYFFFSQVSEPLEYISMCVAVVGIRWALCELKGLYNSKFFVPFNAALSVILTDVLLTATSGGAPLEEYALIFAEGLAAGACAYFFSVALRALQNKALPTQNAGEITACYISGAILLICFSWLKIGSFSLCRTLIILSVIAAAWGRGLGAGAIAGITGASVLSLSGDGMAYISLAYALGGTVAGAAAKKGKAAACAGFLLAGFCAALVYSGSDYITLFMSEAAAASAIFIAIPAKALKFLKAAVNRAKSDAKDDSLRRLLASRLKISAKAFSDIGEIFERVSEKGGLAHDTVKQASKPSTCACCPKRAICDALPSYKKALKDIRTISLENGELTAEKLPQFFRENCQKPDALALCLLREHWEKSAAKSAKKRAADMQSAISGQFIAMSRLFYDINGELADFGTYRQELAEKLEKELRSCAIVPQTVICRRMRGEKTAVEISGYSRFESQKTQKIIENAVKKVLETGVAAPIFSFEKGCFFYKGGQREKYDISYGVAQHSKNNSRFCGDSYNYFYDGKGSAVFILSDGMGTGGRAAVDSAAVCGLFSRMIIAGAGFKSALLMVNSTLLARPDEESAATVDACFVDLYTAKASFIKAGAPYTFIMREQGGEFLNMESLPVGILDGVSYAKKEVDLSSGATVVMLSDGAAEKLSGFAQNAARECERLSAQDAAELLLEKCLSVQESGEDDITVAVIKVKNAADEEFAADKKSA